MSSDLDFDRGDSCGSFEFLSRGVRKGGRRPSAPADESIQEETGDDDLEDEDDEEDKLFCPKRPFGDVGSALPGGQNYYCMKTLIRKSTQRCKIVPKFP